MLRLPDLMQAYCAIEFHWPWTLLRRGPRRASSHHAASLHRVHTNHPETGNPAPHPPSRAFSSTTSQPSAQSRHPCYHRRPTQQQQPDRRTPPSPRPRARRPSRTAAPPRPPRTRPAGPSRAPARPRVHESPGVRRVASRRPARRRRATARATSPPACRRVPPSRFGSPCPFYGLRSWLIVLHVRRFFSSCPAAGVWLRKTRQPRSRGAEGSRCKARYMMNDHAEL